MNHASDEATTPRSHDGGVRACGRDAAAGHSDASSRPSVVCFDLGGVLVRTCRTWAEGCTAAGIPVRAGGGLESKQEFAELHNQHQVGKIDAPTYARLLSERLRRLYSPQEILAVHHAWILGEYEGVGPIVDGLHRLGLRTAALSNTNHAHWSLMPQLRSVQRIQHKLASHELGLRKPDPAIYREFERRLGVAGRAVLFFDDTPENISVARAADWHAVGIDPGRETAPQIAEALRSHGVDV